MSNLHNLEQRLNAIQQLIAKLNKSPLSQDELEELVNGTQREAQIGMSSTSSSLTLT